MYSVQVNSDVEAQLADLPPKRFKQIVLRLYSLQHNPRPPDGTVLDAVTCRVHVGPYRILYHVDDAARHIQVVAIKEQMTNEK